MEHEPWDVIVVGAGAAGLAAARHLRERGVRALVVEARGRIGGRIFPLREGNDPVLELGAEWVHGEPASLLALAARAGESVLSLHPHQLCWEAGRLLPCGERMQRALRRLREPISEDISVAERARREGWLADEWEAAVRFIEGYEAADPERISAIACSIEETSVANSRAHRFARGYGPLCDHLAEGLDIRLHTVVEEVRWKPGEVELRTSQGALSGRALIVTLPLGVLQAPPSEKGALRFSPELPEKAAAAEVLRMGSARKLVIRFHEGIPLPSPAFVHMPSFPVPFWWSADPTPSAIWVGWAGGASAMRLGPDPTEAALATLSQILSLPRGELEARIADLRWWDWDADPFSRGAYGYLTVGGQRAQRTLAEPVAHTLFFAGEATSRDDIGTVQGAVESGWRAAGEVLVARNLVGTPQIRPRPSDAGPIDRAGADAGGDHPGSAPTP